MKTSLFQQKTLQKAINWYGADKQMLIAIEELSELQKAIVKYFRKPTEETRNDISEEIADVYVMLKQLEIMHKNDTDIQKNIDYKIKRLQERIRKEEKGYE
jgi:NTP pyrophosphatase (non-canonical NTP hydrolase)